MKRKMVWTMLLCLLALISACGSVPAPAPVETAASMPTPAPAPKVETYKIGVCIGWYDNGPSPLYWYEIQEYFRTLETDAVKYYVTMADGQKNMQVQLDRIDEFIAQNVDVLLISFVGIDYTPEADEVIDKLKSANIPVVFFYMDGWEKDVYMELLDDICFVCTDDSQFGTYTGEIISDLPDKGDANGDGEVGYVMLLGFPGSVWEETTAGYFVETLADNDIKAEELLRLSGNWNYDEAFEPVASALAQFGSKIDVIYCTTDMLAKVANQAVEAAGRAVGEDIYLVAAYSSEYEGADLLERGAFTGGVLYNYDDQSHAAVDAAIRYLNGQSNDPYTLIDHIKVTPLTQENLQSLSDDLTELDLSGAHISDLTPIEALVKLERLYLSGPHISGFESLNSMINLKCLYLRHSQISDLTPLKSLANLEELDLSYTQISNLTPLESLINLKVLDLSNAQASDLTSLQTLTKLEELYLSGHQISDITPLQFLTNIKTLHLWDTGVSDLTPLKSLKNIETLYLYANELTDTQILDLQNALPDCHIYGYDMI